MCVFLTWKHILPTSYLITDAGRNNVKFGLASEISFPVADIETSQEYNKTQTYFDRSRNLV